MGTSQKLNPGGNPNWGKTSNSLSNLANTIKKENSNPSLSTNRRFQQRKTNAINKAISNYIKSKGGGRNIVSSSRSAIKGGGVLGSWLNYAVEGNFNYEIQSKGFGQLVGKTKNDIVNFLIEEIYGATSDFNDTAGKSAVGQLLDSLLEGIDDASDCERALKDKVDEKGLDNILIEYWGAYIYEDLFQRFEEKLFNSKGKDLCNETFEEIRDVVFSELQVINYQQDISTVDWLNTIQRESIIEDIFKNVINVFENE